MILQQMFNNIQVPLMNRALDTYSTRQKAYSNNMANISTNGYQRIEVNFEKELCRFLYDNPIEGFNSGGSHIPINKKDFNLVRPEPYHEQHTAMDSGINNVDVDKEMAKIAENQIRFNTVSQLMQNKFSIVKSAISLRV